MNVTVFFKEIKMNYNFLLRRNVTLKLDCFALRNWEKQNNNSFRVILWHLRNLSRHSRFHQLEHTTQFLPLGNEQSGVIFCGAWQRILRASMAKSFGYWENIVLLAHGQILALSNSPIKIKSLTNTPIHPLEFLPPSLLSSTLATGPISLLPTPLPSPSPNHSLYATPQNPPTHSPFARPLQSLLLVRIREAQRRLPPLKRSLSNSSIQWHMSPKPWGLWFHIRNDKVER